MKKNRPPRNRRKTARLKAKKNLESLERTSKVLMEEDVNKILIYKKPSNF